MGEHTYIVEPQCLSDTPRKLFLWQILFLFCIVFQQQDALDLGVYSEKQRQKYLITLMSAGVDYRNPEFLAPEMYAKVYRKSRGSPVVMNVFFPIVNDLPITVNLTYTAYQKFSNQWKESFGKGFMGLCQSLESKIKMFRAFWDYSNLPTKCPVTKGNYSIDNFSFENTEMPAFMPLNEWKLKIGWSIGEQHLMSWWFTFKIDQMNGKRPKKNNNNNHR